MCFKIVSLFVLSLNIARGAGAAAFRTAVAKLVSLESRMPLRALPLGSNKRREQKGHSMPCTRSNSRIPFRRPPGCPAKRSMAVIVSATFLLLGALPAQESGEAPLLVWMDGIAQGQLQQRTDSILSIATLEQAQERKRLVRAKLLEDLGGLPDYHGPLHARIIGRIHNDSYTVEKVIYESLPGFYITANVYRPNRPGRYPGVLLQAGHTQEGKPENQRVAANLALKGFVVLCFDPIGQGERVQTYSRQINAPLTGWSVPEHVEMAAQTLLINQGLARYFIWDAMRSLDYLSTRPDVDASHLGSAGCSGGGALTTFTGALDPRLKVVIPGCYPASFRVLFSTMGPDAEMIFPNLLASGLDTADFVEQSAPVPWLLETTETDEYHFSHEGVRLVYDEARRWYSLYHAEENLGYPDGPRLSRPASGQPGSDLPMDDSLAEEWPGRCP